MKDIIPRDLWEYKTADYFYQLKNLFRKSGNYNQLYLAIRNLGVCLPINTGRAALVVALKALKLLPGSNIGVPLFCCPVVFEAIEKAGGKPVFIDCEKDNFCLSVSDLEKKIKSLDCLIVVHMFGNPAEMNDILKIAGRIPVIEDCAQALGTKYRSKTVGKLGSISIFSFRSGKYISAGEGGAIFSADKAIFESSSKIIQRLPIPGRISEFKHMSKVALKSFLRQRPLYGIIGRRIWSAVSNYDSISRRRSIYLSRIYKSDLFLIKKRLEYFEIILQRQRKIASIYLKELNISEEMMSREKPGTFCNRIYFPITFPSRSLRDKMAELLLRNNIDSMKYLDGLVPVARKYFGYKDDCPVSESLSERVLNIPCFYDMSEAEVGRIIDTFNKNWKQISA
ncbi:MAG: DegT/DnrJ/EryC1/StrS family aminotransferase [Candidatus Aminicenantes bacterium]|nr:DegT/DnrJ/EryC1/StrS family aminotransferase [Candidatus Aminicenantes bacterium]